MKKLVGLSALLALSLIVPASLEAATINLTPATPGVIGANLGSANCEPGCVETAFGLPAGSLTGALLYKADVGGADSGSFAASYNTTFANSPADPADATISFVAAPSIVCPNCYLAIKDGNQNPSYYFYNLAGWDGTSDIVMTGFWPNQGAISHVAIWGAAAADDDDGGQDDDGSTVPEPASVLLIGLGMAAVAARMRQRKA